VLQYTGVREGTLLGGRKKFVLKITFLVSSEWGLKPLVNLFYAVEFIDNGFVSNVNSPITGVGSQRPADPLYSIVETVWPA